MRFDGEWDEFDDGIIRPVLRGELRVGTSRWVPVRFLVDTGADRTVLSADMVEDLGMSALQPTLLLGGIGGTTTATEFNATMRLCDHEGTFVTLEVAIAGTSDAEALDVSVLGNDFLRVFAVIFDRPNDLLCLLLKPHTYEIVDG